jgi:hypothetical protein
MNANMKEDSLKETGRCAAASIVEMVAALDVDYDRYTELRDTDPADLSKTDLDEMQALADDAGECSSVDEAREVIQEDCLSVEVRADWHAVGDTPDVANGQFVLLLSTGGPASRIRGELQNGEPHRAWLEVQDWGTPWTQYFGIEQDTLLSFARCFYFGDGS